MKNLMEISKLLLGYNTRHFQKEDINEINLNVFDIISTIYKKDNVTIILASGYAYDPDTDDDYEYEELYATGLTEEEKKRIEDTTQIIYHNKMWEK